MQAKLNLTELASIKKHCILTPMSIQLGEYVLPEHISYSAFTTYVDCGYQYYLGRLMHMPEEPSVWSVGGSAFHRATELWDLENAG